MKLPHEIELMIACAKVHVGQESVAQIQQAAQGIADWKYFVKTCIKHKVLPLVFQNLIVICPDSFPECYKHQLENGYIFENALHNCAIVEQLFFIINLLRNHNILAVPFKGPVLAQNIFGDITLRRYLDLDIIIAKKDADKAVDTFLGNGFVAEDSMLPAGGKRKAYLDRLVAITLIHPDKHFSIDLQWDISNRFSYVPIILEDMENRIEQVELGNQSVPSLPVEELLCYLCLHGTKHRWLALDMVVCVAELIRVRKDLDWQYTVKYAKKIHCSNVLLLGIFLAQDLLEAEIPDYINKEILQTGKIEKLAGKVYEGLFLNYMEHMIKPEKFDSFLFQVQDSLPDKIYYFLKIIFIPSKNDLRLFSLPESLSFVRYILRPMRLITEYCKRRILTTMRSFQNLNILS